MASLRSWGKCTLGTGIQRYDVYKYLSSLNHDVFWFEGNGLREKEQLKDGELLTDYNEWDDKQNLWKEKSDKSSCWSQFLM
jgi:hypothetical protein